VEPILFYGVPQGCSFGSIVALEWLGQPYRLCRIRMPQDMQNPLYDRVNPVRETPALMIEDGTTFSESAAILHHIGARDPSKHLVFRQGTTAYDQLNQALAFLNTTYFAAFSPLWKAYEMEENPPVQEVLRAAGRDEVARAHRLLDAMLADRPWIAGSRRTVADAYFAGLARWVTYHRAIDLADYPRVLALVDRLEDDPAVAFAHAIEAERPATSSGGFRGHVALADLQPRLGMADAS